MRDNGKGNGNYRDYRGCIGVRLWLYWDNGSKMEPTIIGYDVKSSTEEEHMQKPAKHHEHVGNFPKQRDPVRDPKIL